MPAKPTVSDEKGAGLVGAEAGSWKKAFPELASWVCDANYPDGSPIGETQLTVRRRGGTLVGVLKIADQGGLKVEVQETQLDRLFAALEAMLTVKPVPWQRDSFPLGQGGKKKK